MDGDRGRRAVRGARGAEGRGQAAPLRHRARAEDRLARRGRARARRARRPDLAADGLQPARAGARRRVPRARRARYGVGVIARVPDLVGAARGPSHARAHLRGQRPPPPPAALVADRGAAEGRPARLPDPRRRAHARAGRLQVRARPARDRLRDPHGQHRRPARGVGGRRRATRCPTSTRTSWRASTRSTPSGFGLARSRLSHPEPVLPDGMGFALMK